MHVQRWAHTLNDRDGGHCYCYTNSCPLGNEQTPLKVTENRSSAAAMSLVPLTPIRCSFPVFFIQPPPYLPEAYVLPVMSPTDSSSQSKHLFNQSYLSVLVLLFFIAVQLLKNSVQKRKSEIKTQTRKSPQQSPDLAHSVIERKPVSAPSFFWVTSEKGSPAVNTGGTKSTHS